MPCFSSRPLSIAAILILHMVYRIIVFIDRDIHRNWLKIQVSVCFAQVSDFICFPEAKWISAKRSFCAKCKGFRSSKVSKQTVENFRTDFCFEKRNQPALILLNAYIDITTLFNKFLLNKRNKQNGPKPYRNLTELSTEESVLVMRLDVSMSLVAFVLHKSYNSGQASWMFGTLEGGEYVFALEPVTVFVPSFCFFYWSSASWIKAYYRWYLSALQSLTNGKRGIWRSRRSHRYRSPVHANNRQETKTYIITFHHYGHERLGCIIH